MPRKNRVDPWGDLHSVNSRGMLTGNRGCLVDDRRNLVRHHRGRLWIVCRTEFRGWSSPLDEPRHWTPLFFLDDAVALAAGHRPCGLCRREDYLSYRTAVSDPDRRLSSTEIDALLAIERLRPGRGLKRASARRLWVAPIGGLPHGTVIVDHDQPALVVPGGVQPFTFDGWAPSRPVRSTHEVDVLTPPISVRALANGFQPMLHPSAITRS